MPSPRHLPGTSASDLDAAGLVQRLTGYVLSEGQAYLAGEDRSFLLRYMLQNYPDVTPAQRARIITAATKAVQAALEQGALDPNERIPLTEVPVSRGRTGGAEELSRRFLYRTIVDFPIGRGRTRHVTVWFDSDTLLTTQEIIDRARAEAIGGIFPRRGDRYYKEGWTPADLGVTIVSITRLR